MVRQSIGPNYPVYFPTTGGNREVQAAFPPDEDALFPQYLPKKQESTKDWSRYRGRYPTQGHTSVPLTMALPSAERGNRTLDNTDFNPGIKPVKATLIEVNQYTNGNSDWHAQAVKDIYQKNNPLGASNVETIGVGNEEPPEEGGDSSHVEKLTSKSELDDYIDQDSTASFNIMIEKIDDLIKNDDTEVINASLGYSRDAIYTDVLLSLAETPSLATALGLQKSDITSLERDQDDRVLVTDKVASAIVNYVDKRLDRPNSDYQKSLLRYQAATQRAEKNNIAIVVAAGNDHDLNDIFERKSHGGDTNFLAMSHNVISVAASDSQGTADPTDDQIAHFSSRGDGTYNPTLADEGVQVDTPFGKKDGTSFSSPKVAAKVAMLKQSHPELSVAQIKILLQESATDIIPDSTIADGAGIMNPDLAFAWASQPMNQMA